VSSNSGSNEGSYIVRVIATLDDALKSSSYIDIPITVNSGSSPITQYPYFQTDLINQEV
jgi:hypothetical protein